MTRACAAVDDAGQRCSNTVGGYGYKPDEKPGKRHMPYPKTEAIEFQGSWIVSSRLQLDVVELDRWLRQRCRVHASPLHHMWCLPEWEPVDAAKHQLHVYEQKLEWPERFDAMGPLSGCGLIRCSRERAVLGRGIRRQWTTNRSGRRPTLIERALVCGTLAQQSIPCCNETAE